MSIIIYNPGIPPLPAPYEKAIKDTLNNIGLNALTISSTIRTPKQQAQAMYNNLVSLGTDSQRKLYGQAGNKIIDVYVLKKAYGYGLQDTLNAMESEIIKIGAPNVSAHCTSDPLKYVAFDVPPQQIPPEKKSLFENAMSKITSKILIPGKTTGEPVYHLEIKKGILDALATAAKNPAALLIIAGLSFFLIYKHLKKG